MVLLRLSLSYATQAIDQWHTFLQASSTELLLISRLGVTFWGGVGAASVCIVIAAGFNFK